MAFNYFNRNSADPYAPIRIRRRNERELKKAIEDLAKRGFSLLKEGFFLQSAKTFTGTQSYVHRYSYDRIDQNKVFYAVLK